MAVNIADVAVRIRAIGIDPTRDDILKLARDLRGLAESGTSVTRSMGGASETAQSLYYAFNGLAGSALGVNQSISDLFARVAQVAVGTTWTAGILLGITVLGHAWKEFGGAATEAADEQKKAAAEIKRTIDDLVNAGDFAKLQKMYRDTLYGTASGFYQNGISGLREQRARLVAEREAALAEQRRELAQGAGGLGTGAGNVQTRGAQLAADLEQQIAQIDTQLSTLQDTANKAYGALTDPRNGQRFADNVVAPIVTNIKTARREMIDAAKAWKAALADMEHVLEHRQMPGVGVTPDTIYKGIEVLNAQLKEHPIKLPAQIVIEPNALTKAREKLVEAFANIGNDLRETLGDSVGAAFRELGRGGGPGGAIKAFGASLLSGFGAILVALGKQTLAASGFMAAIKAAFKNFNPVAMAVAGAGLIALGSFIGGMGERALGASGGGGGGGYSGPSVAAAANDPIRYTIGTGAVSRAVVGGAVSGARTPVNVNLLAFGTPTPTQQRELMTMIRDAERRGL